MDYLHHIRQAIEEQRVEWTYHTLKRLRERQIRREYLMESDTECEIIEGPDLSSAGMPCVLILFAYRLKTYHAVLGINEEENIVRVVTVYEPDAELWSDDFRRRK